MGGEEKGFSLVELIKKTLHSVLLILLRLKRAFVSTKHASMHSKLKEKYAHKPHTTSSVSASTSSGLDLSSSNQAATLRENVISPSNGASFPSSQGMATSSASGSLASVYAGKPKWLEMRLTEALITRATTYSSSKLVFRPVSDAFPVNNIVASKTPAFPLGISVQPFADEGEIPLVGFGANTIPRCDACRAYMNPFMQFLNDGYKFKCNICKYIDNVPNYYYSSCGADGVRDDLESRPELLNGSYEFKAGNE